MADSINRSVAKSITWRIIASLTTALLALLFGMPQKAVGFLFLADMIIKFIMYIGHERLWANIPKLELTIFKKKV